MIVLDASALLAYLFREAGHDQVSELLAVSVLSSVNLAEVIGRFVRDGHDGRRVLGQIEASPIEVIAFSAVEAVVAGELIPSTRHLGLSLGDRACLALAITRGYPALTADQNWSALSLGVEIRQIR